MLAVQGMDLVIEGNDTLTQMRALDESASARFSTGVSASGPRLSDSCCGATTSLRVEIGPDADRLYPGFVRFRNRGEPPDCGRVRRWPDHFAAGGLLLGACNKAIRLIGRLAQHFRDGRDPDALLHTVPALLGQRIFAIALGYEDISDHDHLRHDPVLQVLAGKLTAKRSNCAALAGKSTLNRLEYAAKVASDPNHKITYDEAGIAALFVTLCLESYWAPPQRFVIDLDTTHDAIHGELEGRHFHGYYD